MTKPYADIPFASIPFGDADGPGPSELMAKLAMEQGPIFRRVFVRDNGDEWEQLWLVGPEANRFVLHTHREYFSHNLGWTPVIGDLFGHGLLNMDPPEHTRHRAMMNPAFTAHYMASYLPLMNDVIRKRTADWAARGDIDLFTEAREITFDVAAGALTSVQDTAQVNRMRELFYTVLHGFGAAENSWEEWAAGVQRAQQELNVILERMIAERRATPPTGAHEDVLSMIVHARDDQGETLSDEQVMAHARILLVAGHETTTTMGAFALYLLARHPNYRARVLKELNDTLGGRDEPISYEAIRATPILGNAIKEAGRLHSPVNALPRGVLKPVEFAGYEIPIGTMVRLGVSAGHRLPTVFAQPDAFDPDRFAPPRDEERKTPYGLIPFGGGTRICIGINFAQIEVKALVAHVLRRFDLTPVSDRDPEQWLGITTFLPGGIPVRATARA